MSFRLVAKSVTLNYLERRNGVILSYFSEFGYLPGVLRKSSRSLSHLLMSSCYVIGRTIIFSRCGYFFLLLFSSPNLSGRRLDVYHTSTHGVALYVNLEFRSEMCCMRIAENTGRKKVAKNRHLGTIAQICRDIFPTTARIDNRKKLVKQQYVLQMSSQYGELRPTSG